MESHRSTSLLYSFVVPALLLISRTRRFEQPGPCSGLVCLQMKFGMFLFGCFSLLGQSPGAVDGGGRVPAQCSVCAVCQENPLHHHHHHPQDSAPSLNKDLPSSGEQLAAACWFMLGFELVFCAFCSCSFPGSSLSSGAGFAPELPLSRAEEPLGAGSSC